MTCPGSGYSHEPISIRTYKDIGCDDLGVSVDNLSGRQLLDVDEATVIQQIAITEVIAVAASETSTCAIDTEGEQDGHIRSVSVAVQSNQQISSKRRNEGTWLINMI